MLQTNVINKFQHFPFHLVDSVLYLFVILLSVIIILLSKKGFLGKFLEKFCSLTTNSLSEFFIVIFIISSLIMMIISLLFSILTFSLEGFNLEPLCVLDPNNSNAQANVQDPVRWWPSLWLGTAQTWGILGSAMAAYRITSGNHRVKAAAALAAVSIAIPANVFAFAVENPTQRQGFNRLMYSWMKYKQTGNWPANIPAAVSNDDLKPIDTNSTINKFLPSDKGNIFDNLISDDFLNYILRPFRPVPVEGFLDDLIGQQLFIHFLLLLTVIGLIIFLSLYMFIRFMHQNKDFIINRFNNRYILWYLKYQFFLAKINLYLIPLILMFGLIELFIGLYFLITHPIPYENLGIDLHIYINSENCNNPTPQLLQDQINNDSSCS